MHFHELGTLIDSKNCKKYDFSLEKVWYICGIFFFPKKVSHSKEFPMFGIIVTLENCGNSVGVSHWNIFSIFMETCRQSFSIHFGVFVENVWKLVGIFGYIGSMRTAKHFEKLWKLDGNFIRKFLGIWLDFNFGTVLEFLRKRKGNSFEIFWNRMVPFGIILETV